MIPHNMDTVAKRIKYARALKFWNQRQLALASGLTPSGIGNIESEAREGKGSLPQIAEALGVSYKWLAHGVGEMRDTPSEPKAPAAGHLSPLAQELAEMFDLIPTTDRIRRAQAYAAAMESIVSVLESQPIAAPAKVK